MLAYKLIMVGYGHQAEEVVIYVAYFKIVCAMGVERRDKRSALLDINKNNNNSDVPASLLR